MHKQQLIKKLDEKNALISIVGLGYVGLPLMLRFAEVGYRVLGIDIDENKINSLAAGISYIRHIPSDKINELKNNIAVSNDFSKAQEADVIILCVPTPLNKYREPDLSFVINTIEALKPFLRHGQLVSLESTTYPGTTDEEIKPRIETASRKVGEDIFLVYSPEREDPGNMQFTTANIPKLCGGYSPACLELGIKLYSSVIQQVVPLSSTRAAEMTKLLENIHRSVNIGLVNEMKIVADKMHIDIYEVINAAATKPFGFVPYYPGPGIGGHCIPIDPFYLTWKAREFNLHTRFIELAGEINNSMPKWVVNKLNEALNKRRKSINGSKVLILGVAYKMDIDDMRESPSLEIMEILNEKGAILAYSDPYVAKLRQMREHNFQLESVNLTAESLTEFDCVLLATAHKIFDYDLIAQYSQLIIDTRGAFRKYPQHNIIAA